MGTNTEHDVDAAGGRLGALLDELDLDAFDPRGEGPDQAREGLDETLEALRADAQPGPRDAFFTARVLDALPEPLGWTGVSPLMRVATLLGFHVAAAVVGVIVYRWASPRVFDVAADRAAEAASPWAASLSLLPSSEAWSGALLGDAAYPVAVAAVVSAVGVVAFWATRSHTRAT